MTSNEREFLGAEMAKAHRYLEYGAGGSTQMAVACENLTNIYSVESDPKFVTDTLAKDPAIMAAQNAGRLHFKFIDIGPTRMWGYPKNRSKIHLWPNYALTGFGQGMSWDLILVDGRFRVACVILAALEASARCRVLVHDFTDRSEYKAMLRFMRIARQVDALVLLEKRPDFKPKAAQRALRKYLYAPGDRVGLAHFRYILGVLRRRAFGKE